MDGRRPKRWRQGDAASASRLNRLATGIERIQRDVDAAGMQQADVTPAPPDVRQMQVQSEGEDYLVCRLYGYSVGSADIYVAKPYKLRGNIATRTVSSEDQEILPAYTAEDIIYAFGPVRNGTDVAEVDGVGVYLIDLNIDGRMWAESLDE